MAARPPSNELDDEPNALEFGIVALDGAVDDWDISFPITAEELSNTYGDERLAVDPAGHEITLEEAVSECDQRRFETKQELLNCLHPVFEAKRERLSGTLLGRLRSLVPF